MPRYVNRNAGSPAIPRSLSKVSRENARYVACPKCGAGPGEQCFAVDGSYRASNHLERHRAYLAPPAPPRSASWLRAVSQGYTGSMTDVTAPWTDDQVTTLNRFQAGGWFHPFTCGWRSEHPDNEGVLIASSDGWRCPADGCTYRQRWAHHFMVDAEWVERMQQRHDQMFGDQAGE